MRLIGSLVCATLASAAFAQYPGSEPPPSDLKKGFDTITVGDAKRVLTYLATKCDGRGTGQPGFEKAAQFIAKQFQSLHLKPMGDNGTYFQKADFTRWRFDPASLKLHTSKVTIGGKDLILRGGPPTTDVKGPIVSVTVPPDKLDLGSTTFKGDLVILQTDKRNMRLENSVLDSGAVAVFTVVKTKGEASWHPRMGTTPPTVRPGLAGTISQDAAAKLFKVLESTPKTEAKTEGGLNVVTYTSEASLQGKLVVETVKVGNVVAELPGSDPKLANQFVGIGGHLDHLGINDGVIYPGADDDGSGSTAVVEIARAMTANKLKPRRSILFMTFFGEEMGLLGSRFLTDHPPVPLPDMVSELQMDMVGRDSDGVQNGDRRRVDVATENVDTIRLVGSKRISTELDRVIQEENKFIGFKFKYDAEDVYTRSDHYNFAAKGIPIAFLFDGFHPDYHRPTDTIDKIDWLKLTNAAKLYYLTALRVANVDNAPVKDVTKN
jgi:Zn-dependent M28 family amino/carboxypeptidase